MWHSDDVTPSSSSTSGSSTARPKLGSVSQLSRQKQPLLKRALSFQFLNKVDDNTIDRETKAYIRMRYKDISKYVIWPSCRIEGPIVRTLPSRAPLEPVPHDPRAILFKADMEDEKTPYLPANINHVLRSDSEGSSDDEEVVSMTRL